MKCINNDTDNAYAVKILRSSQDVSAEIDALTQCRGHSNIVSIVDVMKDEAFTYIVTEWLAGSELFKYAKEQHLPESDVRGIFKEILHAVTHMHNKNIAHRDLKLENIKFTSDNFNKSNIKILDFGFACKINNKTKMSGPFYTLDYAAPEILSNKKYTESCDLWSMGVILYALLCGSLPFRRQKDVNAADRLNTNNKVTARIKRGSIDLRNARWISLSDLAKDLIRRLLTVTPEKRIKLPVIYFSQRKMLNLIKFLI